MSTATFDTNFLEFAVNDYFTLSKFKRNKPSKLIKKILQNILAQPEQQKFRKLKTSALESKWGRDVLEKTTPLLQTANFVIRVDNGSTFLVCEEQDLTMLEVVLASFSQRCDEEEQEIQRQREEIAQRTKSQLSQVETAEQRRKNLVKQKMLNDRAEYEQERRENPVTASKANKLKYGRTDVALEFQTNSGG